MMEGRSQDFIDFSAGYIDGFNPIGLPVNALSEALNVEHTKYKAIKQRNGYLNLTSTSVAASQPFYGLVDYEHIAAGGGKDTVLVAICNSKIYKMDDLDGVWDDITSGTVTSGNTFWFAHYNNELVMTNGNDVPLKVDNNYTVSAADKPTNMDWAKYCVQFNNYFMYVNVSVSGVEYPSRFYYNKLNDVTSFPALRYYNVDQFNGQEITAPVVWGDRLVIFKERSIYNVVFTGSNTIPFYIQKSNSNVGCVAPLSVQEVDNGLMFLSYDGIYFYDGNNSTKISREIGEYLRDSINPLQLAKARSVLLNNKDMYLLSLPSITSTDNDVTIALNYYLKAYTIWTGMAPAYWTNVFVNQTDERLYFGDYDGWVYRADTGDDDYPLGVQTAIEGSFALAWRDYGTISEAEHVLDCLVWFKTNQAINTISLGFDLESGYVYSETFDTSVTGGEYDTAVYGTDVYANEGYDKMRKQFKREGKITRIKISNCNSAQTFEVYGISQEVKHKRRNK